MISSAVAYDLPQAAYLIFGIFLFLGLSWSLFLHRQRMLSYFIPSASAFKLLIPRSTLLYWLKVAAVCLGWCLAALALMQPKGNARYPEDLMKLKSAAQASKHVEKNQAATLRLKDHEVIFLIDASASMSVNDTRENKTRLDYAKEIADEIASDLNGETVSLYAFTSEVSQLSPPTLDYLFLRLMLRQIQINEGGAAGTDIKEALSYMRKNKYAEPSKKLWTLILMTDGGDTKMESLQGAQREQDIADMLNLLSDAEKLNLRVFTIGLGTKTAKPIPNMLYHGQPVKSALDEDLLRKLSQTGRGSYYFANDLTAIEMASDIVKAMNQDSPYMKEETVKGQGKAGGSAESNEGKEELVYDLYYQLPLGFAILLLGFGFLFPDTLAKRREIKHETHETYEKVRI